MLQDWRSIISRFCMEEMIIVWMLVCVKVMSEVRSNSLV